MCGYPPIAMTDSPVGSTASASDGADRGGRDMPTHSEYEHATRLQTGELTEGFPRPANAQRNPVTYQRYQRARPPPAPSAERTRKPRSQTASTTTATIQSACNAKPAPPNANASNSTNRITMAKHVPSIRMSPDLSVPQSGFLKPPNAVAIAPPW